MGPDPLGRFFEQAVNEGRGRELGQGLALAPSHGGPALGVIGCALTEAGQRRFVEMADDMELNYQRLVSRLGEDKLALLHELLDELKAIEP